MGVGERILAGLISYRKWRQQRIAGPLGDFYRNGGQEQLYDKLPITADDIVIDGGGYQGEWTDEILCRYGCHAIIFEPVPLFAESLRRRYARNSRVEVCETALSNKAGNAEITFSMDGSSIFNSSDEATTFDISMVDVSGFLQDRNIKDIACLKLNIEGGEYDVLERLMSLNLLGMVCCLLVQFHVIDPQSEMRRASIQKALAKTHKCQFDYPFVWECWTRVG